MIRFLTAGESHGKGLTAIVEGLPALLPLTEEMVAEDLIRRQQGYGRGGRMRIEKDRAEFVGGVRHGLTTGAPIAMWIPNRDWANWELVMAAHPPSQEEAEASEKKAFVLPRPGHADLAGAMKFGHRDLRNVLERASARETAARVAVGACCRALLLAIGAVVESRVVELGGIPFEEQEAVKALIDKSRVAGDTLGGVFEITATGVPPGLGSYAQWDKRLDGKLAGSLMSIPAIKGVEVGMGFETARLPGSLVHDPIQWHQTYTRPSNHAGGLEGGITNGEPIVVRAAMKPIPTLRTSLPSVEITTHEEKRAHFERSDVTSVPAAAVVGEAMVCITLADALLDKFGHDSLPDILRAIASYKERLY